MSFASLCVFTYTYPVSFLSKCHRKEPQRSSCAFYHATAKKILWFPGLKLKRPAISRKKNFLQTQKEVLARALFLGCTVSYYMCFCILVVTASWIKNLCALLSWLLQIACLVQISGGIHAQYNFHCADTMYWEGWQFLSCSQDTFLQKLVGTWHK